MESSSSHSSTHSCSSADVDSNSESYSFDSEPECGSASEVHHFMYEPMAADRDHKVLVTLFDHHTSSCSYFKV